MLSCNSSNMTIISEGRFIEDLNSFDSTAVVVNSSMGFSTISVLINYHDSLFVYNVEKTDVTVSMYPSMLIGGRIK